MISTGQKNSIERCDLRNAEMVHFGRRRSRGQALVGLARWLGGGSGW